jgi:tetratricopeptide (TPR) repeat protein
MRLRVTFVFLLCGLLCAPAVLSWADTIHLKNGQTILADHVRENGNKYEYDIGDDSYAIPKSSVDRVESGGMPVHASAAAKVADLPTFTPTDSFADEGDLVARIIKDGKVDDITLADLEKKGNPQLSAAANFIAGKFELQRGNMTQSRRYFESALTFQPDSSTILTYLAALLVRTGNAKEASSFAQRAVSANPTSADAYAILGYAEFASDRTRDAIAAWKHSVALRPDPAIQRLLDKAQREQTAESEFSQNESSHFVLHYEGKESPEGLRTQIMQALEADYDDLVRDLGTPPHDSILVTLYTDTAFFDVTHAPTWVGAINDGKLRIPVSGLSSMSPELARVLKHELTHSFVRKLSGGRCPPWLNEGIAQLLEPRNLSEGHFLAQIYKNQQQIPFNTLEGSFIRFNDVEAHIAYAESLAAVSYINESYGLSDVQRILDRINQGSSTEAALRAVIHSDYGQFETELGKYLADRYGS